MSQLASADTPRLGGIGQSGGSVGAHAPLAFGDVPAKCRHCHPRVASEPGSHWTPRRRGVDSKFQFRTTFGGIEAAGDPIMAIYGRYGAAKLVPSLHKTTGFRIQGMIKAQTLAAVQYSGGYVTAADLKQNKAERRHRKASGTRATGSRLRQQHRVSTLNWRKLP